LELLDTIYPLDTDVFRNIVSLKESVDLFAQLTGDDPEFSDVAIEAEERVKANIPSGIIDRGFHYNTAIEYPFKIDPFMLNRYGDGTYGVWYGSLEQETTIYETAYHGLIKLLGDIHGLTGIIKQERAVYQVHCEALLVDLREKKSSHPELTSNDYSLCQQIGHRLNYEGHPGLLAPSARCEGSNLVLFEIKVLTDPGLSHYLSYEYVPDQKRCIIKRGGKQLMDISYS